MSVKCITNIQSNDISLTGDRPTGPLHLGHYIGSIKNRMLIQSLCEQTVLIADLQALTDNSGNPQKVKDNVLELMLDYLSCGLDPAKNTFCLQSSIPELAELSFLFMNLVSVAELEKNPTIKNEISLRGFEKTMPIGFLTYPVSQAADILAFGATVVPVGDDQLPMIELSRKIAKRINNSLEHGFIKLPAAILSDFSRLPGTDGFEKASKSRGNAISLSATNDDIKKHVKSMYTDPNHTEINLPGSVKNNVVFAYLDAFDPDKVEVNNLKQHYQEGGLGDTALKNRLTDILIAIISPIRERRDNLKKDIPYVYQTLRAGTDRSREIADTTLRMVRSNFKLHTYNYCHK